MAGPSIERKPFGTTHDGIEVEQIILANGTGATAKILTYGATLAELHVPDRDGRFGDVVLGFDNIRPYEFESPYFGSTIGRVGNRIANGRFSLDYRTHQLAINNGPNHLHGGLKGYSKRVWNAETMVVDGPTVRFTLDDPDGTEGYPGNVHISVAYTLTADNALKLQYFATTDAATPINLTNHTYFNLKDGGRSSALGHVFQAQSDEYIPVNDVQIPTGEIAKVAGTPIDFRQAKPLGQDIEKMLGTPIGYDHTLVVRGWDGTLRKAAEVYEPESGRRMTVETTEPGFQLYAGLFLSGVKGKDGARYDKHHGFCLETQHYPDSVNHKDFPTTILQPGETYRQVTVYRFSS